MSSEGSPYEGLLTNRKEYLLCLEALRLKAAAEGEYSAKDKEDDRISLHELAESLDGIEYLEERPETCEKAKKSGYVVVFGYSDDNMEFRGAVEVKDKCL